MAVTSIRRTTPKAQPIPMMAARKGTERVAVLLNAHARNVNDKVRREIERFVPAEDIFLSHSFEEAREIAARVLDEGYTTLLTGGGDGTFVGFVNEVTSAIDAEVPVVGRGSAARQLAPRRRMPKFGVLRLGTGNAVATLTGSSSSSVGVVEDIIRARSGDVRRTRELHLVSVNGKRAPFAGMGIDAKVLNDYVALKSRFQGTPLAGLTASVGGYLVAGLGMTVPSLIAQREVPTVTVTNEGAPAIQVGPDGKPVGKPVPTGGVLYQGKCRIAAASTVPTYGYGFTLFPHALRSPGKMHLRLTAMNVTQIVRHLPAIWRGQTPCASLIDFHAERVRVSFDRPMPLQIGGDAEGYRDHVVFGVDPTPVELLDFKAV